jgi:cytochrome bd-type quinol oxidase subunit 2
VFLLFIFPRQIETLFSVFYVVVLAAITGMIFLHYGADLCKQIARRLWGWGLELVFGFLFSIP